jgi:hypothetical protein
MIGFDRFARGLSGWYSCSASLSSLIRTHSACSLLPEDGILFLEPDETTSLLIFELLFFAILACLRATSAQFVATVVITCSN